MNRIEKFFRSRNPEYRPRWEAYNTLLAASLSREKVWYDIGCGANEFVEEFGSLAGRSLGIDRAVHPGMTNAPFLQAPAGEIPLPSRSADLITLRMVVEHFEHYPDDIAEIHRLLKPGGLLIVMTTNALSPIVFVPRLIPFRLKEWIIRKLFRVDSSDVYPTYHRFNTPGKFAKGFGVFHLQRLEYLEQISPVRPVLTLLFGLWYVLTKPRAFQPLRSNILAVFQQPVP